jgi:hypothetical protein
VARQRNAIIFYEFVYRIMAALSGELRGDVHVSSQINRKLNNASVAFGVMRAGQVSSGEVTVITSLKHAGRNKVRSKVFLIIRCFGRYRVFNRENGSVFCW